MKKFMTVLLVIAVMFTFSFGSAFAQKVDYVADQGAKVLYKDTAYADATGKYGITEAYRNALVDGLQAILDNEATTDTDVLTTDDTVYNVASTQYYAPEEAEAKAAIEKAIADVKAAATAEDAATVITNLKTKLDKLLATEPTIARYKTDIEGATTEISFDRLIARYGESDSVDGQSAYAYYLTGYGLIPANAVTETETTLDALNTTYAFVTTWFMDNEYRVDFEAGVKAFLSALVPVTQTFKDEFNKEIIALEDELYDYVDKYDSTSYKNKLTVADLAGLDALLGKVDDFNDKYYGYDQLDPTSITDFQNAVNALAGEYYNQYYTEIAAIPASNKLDDTHKAGIIALYDKVADIDSAYENVWAAATSGKTVDGMGALTSAYNFYKNADIEDLTTAATKFSFLNAAEKDFDKSEENVAALEAARKLYDENVKNYGVYNSAIEAKILAAEHNKDAAAGYKEEADKIDTSKVQAFLNNATVKVTTKALGNKKIRVNANIDADSFNYVMAEMSDGATVEYQFYYKKAKAEEFKAGKVRDVNYTTFKLAKGVKYHFHCEVTIKDMDGNVVATKDYKASTLGVRTAK